MSNKSLNIIKITVSGLKYIILLIAALLILTLILLGSAYGDLKAAAMNGLAGKTALSQAAAAAQAQNWSNAIEINQQAQASFSAALDKLNNTRSNPAIKHFFFIRNQVDDLEYILKTAEIISRSLSHILPIIQDLDQIRAGSGQQNFADMPAAKKAEFLQLIYESEPELNGLNANLKLAVLNLDKIHHIGVLWPFYNQISDIKTELNEATVLMDKLSPLIKLLPALAGYPNPSRFLLALQNNDELRASGGFIGVYGILESRYGEIISLKTDDSYHLDMPASQSADWTLEPPAPLKKYLKVEKWYLRDANWSPDWPTAAKQINYIFQGESRAIKQPTIDFTGIVAINPDFVADLIRLVGPITVNGATYNADNFQTLLQYNVEMAYKEQDISSWDRKEIINELIGELKIRLLGLSIKNWAELFKIIQHNLAIKNIQLYFPNEAWESIARSLGASGEVKQSDGDYLLAIDSNLAAFKSDAVVKKNLKYTVSETKDSLDATLTLNYQHGGDFDWRTTRYRSYTRVFAPLGSRLLSIEGADPATVNTSVYDDKALNKTVFAFFFSIEPGKTGNLNVNYRLPDSIKQQISTGSYHLLVQRQAGQRIESLKVIIKPLSGKTRQWTTDLEEDKIFGLNK